jgi:hypothetical protein
MLLPGYTFSHKSAPLHPRVFGWLLCATSSNAGHLRSRHIFDYLFFHHSFNGQNNTMASPHTLRPNHASTLSLSKPQTPNIGWLLYPIIKRQPPKANTPPISLFFDAHCFVNPTKGTSHRDREPSTGRLQQTHREQGRNDLGAPLLYP